VPDIFRDNAEPFKLFICNLFEIPAILNFVIRVKRFFDLRHACIFALNSSHIYSNALCLVFYTGEDLFDVAMAGNC